MAYEDVIMADDPERYWRLGDAVSSTEFVDETGAIASRSTTVSGATFGTTGILPNGDADTAVDFDGDDFLTVADSANPTSWSIEMWIRPDVSPVSLGLFCYADRVNPVGGSHALDLFITSGGVLSVRAFDGAAQTVTGTTSILQDTVYHVVITGANSGALKLYVNGQEEGTADTIGTLGATMTHYWIGVESQNNTFMSGKIDEVAIYHEVLTDQQIEDHYTAGTEAEEGGSLLPLVACDMRNIADMGGMRG